MFLVLFPLVSLNQVPEGIKTSGALVFSPSPKPQEAAAALPITIVETITELKYIPPAPVYYPPQAPVVGQGDSYYMNYVFSHESGNDPTRANSAGCLGLGQACPGSKLLAVCPTLDYNCEVTFFTNYAISRYGSWQNAYLFWVNNHWW